MENKIGNFEHGFIPHPERNKKYVEIARDIVDSYRKENMGTSGLPLEERKKHLIDWIANALFIDAQEQVEKDAKIAEDLVKEKSWFSGSKYVIASFVIATAIRNQKLGG